MPPVSQTLAEMWPKLERGLRVILATLESKESLSIKEWFELYNCVHDHCTATRRVGYQSSLGKKNAGGASFVGKDLYEKLQSFLIEYLKDILMELRVKKGEELLSFYSRRWTNYTISMAKVNHVFNYLNRHWIKREAEDGRKVYEVYIMSLVTWRDQVFNQIRERLTDCLLVMIKGDRDGEQVDHSLIKAVVSSYASLGLDNESTRTNTLDVYAKYFEQPFLEATLLYYTQESSQFIASNPVVDYLKKMERRFEEEDLRVSQYLHESTRPALIETLQNCLVGAHRASMWGVFQELLQDMRTDDLRRMYSLLSRLVDGLPPLQQLLESYVTTCGEKAMQTLAEGRGVERPRDFVEALLQVYHRFNRLIRDAFDGDPQFIEALDKACRTFINQNVLTEKHKGRSLAAELLARYVDTVLRRTSERLEDSEREKTMDDVMILFKYVEEKDAFMAFYSKRLATRLISRSSASEHLEGIMIHKLKEACGYENTTQLTRMYQDMGVCKELQNSFRTHLESLSKRPSVDFDILVLTKGIWPLKDSASSFEVPQELVTCKNLFEEYYASKHSGRKLSWLAHRSKGELKCLHLPKPYILQCSLYQMGVLLLFNAKKILSAKEIIENSSLQSSLAFQVLQTLLRCRVLVARPKGKMPLSVRHQFTLNPRFSSQRVKVNINMALPGEQKADRGETQRQIEEGRRLEIQACIVRIMKMRKQLQHRQLVQEVIEQLLRRFEARVSLIKRCIDILIEKEYLERVEGKKDTYSYMA